MPDKFIEGVKKQKIEQRIEHYNDILKSGVYEKTSPEYIRAQDVIEEIENLLKNASSEYSFVDIAEIERRLEEYFKRLEYLDRDYLKNKKENLEEELGKTSSSNDEKKLRSLDEIFAEIDALSKMGVRAPTKEEVKTWKSNRPKSNAERKQELEEIEKALENLDERDEADLDIQKRVIKNRIDELQDISKEKELFKINEKGEITINYPEVVPELDEKALVQEYLTRKADMVDKFYGNKQKAKDYAQAIKRFSKHVEFKDFEYIDENGNTKKGEYRTISDYPGREEDMELAQMEELVTRLERLSKWEAGDKSVYNEVYVRDQNSKIKKLSPEEARIADEEYVNSNNNAYNRIIYTAYNLKTLGKYGEKVDYTKLQKGQPVKNVLRAVGNTGKFLRNHITAPINKAVGTFIVSPTYALIAGANRDKVAGLYDNKRVHRYVARREYYQAQGQGYFKSRFNSLVHPKEANQAILNAGAYEVQESVRAKHIDIAMQDAMRKKIEFASKSVAEKIEMIKADMQGATGENKAKYQATLADLEKAKAQIERDRALNERAAIRQTKQTDAIDSTTHDVANKENVTRTITGFKILTRIGIQKLVGPKIHKWLEEHTTKNVTVKTEPTQQEIQDALHVSDKKWVPSTYKEVTTDVYETKLNTDLSMSDMMQANAGKSIEGYYTVWGGVSQPKQYQIAGNETITAIFESDKWGGHGLSDLAGLKAPGFTSGTFAEELLDANGYLKQNVSLDKILEAINKGAMKPEDLTHVYVSVEDSYWAKLSDLCKGLTKEVKTGTTMSKVVDVAGHYENLTEAQVTEAVKAALDTKLAADPNFLQSLAHETVQTVPNERVVKALAGINKGAVGIGFADDIYENTRQSKPNDLVESIKPEDRRFDANSGFTGDRKTDLKYARKDKKRASSVENDDRDER